MSDRAFIVGVPNVDDPAIRATAFVLDDTDQCVDGVINIEETPSLSTPIDQTDIPAMQYRIQELAYHATGTLLLIPDVVQSRAKPVERAKQGKGQVVTVAIGVDDPIHQLLAVGIDPAFLVDRACDQRAAFFVVRAILAHPVYFRRGRKQDSLPVFDAVAHDLQIRLEIQLKHGQRILDIRCRGGNGHQRQNDITFLYMIFNPFSVDGDVALDIVEARINQ